MSLRSLPLHSNFFEWVRGNEKAFLLQIADEVKKICAVLKIKVSDALLNNLVIDVPNHRRVQQGQESVYFERPAMLPLRWTLPLDQIVQYYENRSLAYVFAPRELCGFVSLACERLIWEWQHVGLLYVQEEGVSANLVRESEGLRLTLLEAHYYDTCPQLKPLSKYLKSSAAQEQIDKVVNNLVRFRSWRGQRITAAHVRSFAIQFEEDLHESILALLGQIVMIEPSEIAASVIAEYRELKAANIENVAVVPLGNLTDSATHLLYELKNHQDQDVRELGPHITPLQAATVQYADYLLFFDDNTNSGLQVLNVFADWLGVTLPPEVNLDERHVDSLPEKSQEKLKKTKISFVFGVAPEGVEAKIKGLFEKYLQIPAANIKVRIGRVLLIEKRLLSGGSPAVDIPRKVELRKFLDSVGKEMMQTEGKSPDKAEKRSMGEDRVEALVVFPYNTPTMTITALWCRGRFNKTDWIPLIERRRNVRGDGKFSGEDA